MYTWIRQDTLSQAETNLVWVGAKYPQIHIPRSHEVNNGAIYGRQSVP